MYFMLESVPVNEAISGYLGGNLIFYPITLDAFVFRDFYLSSQKYFLHSIIMVFTNGLFYQHFKQVLTEICYGCRCNIK